MKIGVVSDTHSDKANALPHIMAEFKRRGVEAIIHCGDIEPKHLKPELFNNLPVICALNDEQVEKPVFRCPPANWKFTFPNPRQSRIVDLFHVRMYVGHKRSFDFLAGSETELTKIIDAIRKTHDGLRWMFSGHTHHQILFQTQLVNFVNPGAVEDSLDGYEFVIVDLENDEIVFSRILKTSPVEPPISIGIISDSLNISRLDPTFWQKLAKEFADRGVSHVIHCGNISSNDIGRDELSGIQVYYHMQTGYQPSGFSNWHHIPEEEPIVEIQGYQFFIKPDLARILLDDSEIDMHKLCLEIKAQFPYVGFVLYGGTNDAFLEEGHQVRILNPGDAVRSRNFAVVCLPRAEITFGHVPIDPLPPI